MRVGRNTASKREKHGRKKLFESGQRKKIRERKNNEVMKEEKFRIE